MDYSDFTTPRKTDLLISFADIQGFVGISRALPDPVQLFGLLDGWAAILAAEIEKAGGRVVKFIGDSCLAIFPDDGVDAGALALVSAKEKAESYLREKGFSNRIKVTAHFGQAALGPLGAGSCRTLDVIGDSVNVAASLGRGDHPGRFIISPQAFRKLSAATRKRFHKHTPPIVYVAAG